MKHLDVIDLFLKILSMKSVTPDDGGILDFVESYLDDFDSYWFNEGGVKNLFLTKKFGEGRHLAFVGHVDVVPAGDNWQTNPFVPMIEDGYIYARGTQDMKSGVASMVCALRDIENFNGRLSLMLTSDEEGDGTFGIQYMLPELKKLHFLPDECIIAEPTCENVFGDTIKIGRRGSINGVLVLKGKQGHAAYPEKTINPINLIAPILTQLAGINLDDGDSDFNPTTMVVTDIRSGMEIHNVTPASLKIMFNLRNSTKTLKEDVKIFIEDKFSSLDYDLKLEQSSFPFVTNRESALVKKITKVISSVTNQEPKLSTAGGTSDGRHIAPYGVDVVEFGVINNRIHAVDERTTIKEVESLYKIFVEVLKTY